MVKDVLVLEGDTKYPNLIASSVYSDTKPVLYLSMVSNSIKWIVKEKHTYTIDTGTTLKLWFLHMNYINQYNNKMWDVDISD